MPNFKPSPGRVTSAAWSSDDPELTRAAVQILLLAGQLDDAGALLAAALPLIAVAAGADFVAVVSSQHGHWTQLAAAGTAPDLPTDLLAEALDREAAAGDGPWAAAPLESKAASGEVLVLHQSPPAARLAEAAEALAVVCGRGLADVRRRRHQQLRTQRLSAILDIAGRWNQNRELESLLTEMAEAATRLLEADRASIFLWDRPNRVLVGRPALGVANGELRLPDHEGIVGQVLQSGEPKRVDLAEGQEQISRHVDAQLGYRTQTLLCVPLRGRRGELLGVFEMINKRRGNFTDEDLDSLTELAAQAAVALENVRERTALLESRRLMTDEAARGVQLIGRSRTIEALRSTVKRVAKTDLAVLIQGENGTGKEVVSQMIHYLSRRRDQPFVAVNCAAIAETLLESELFGHEKGAFTDAHEARPGKFELASGGTLFLDEIGDLSPGGQSKLLRVIEEKVVVRVGGSKSIHTDARVIAATNQDLAEMVGQGRFRRDLYFRLNVVALQIPPLRERGDDIELLAEHFLTEFCKQARRKPLELSAAARRRLQNHSWPGNVRELRNLMERLAYLAPGERIEADDPAFVLTSTAPRTGVFDLELPLSEATEKFQIEYLQRAIERCHGNLRQVARQLGLHRSNLYRKLRQLGMTVDEAE